MYLDRIDSRSRSCRSEKGKKKKKEAPLGAVLGIRFGMLFSFLIFSYGTCRHAV